MTRLACTVVALATLSSPAFSQIYKCTETDGNVTYQESRCPRGTRGHELAVDSSTAPAPRAAPGRAANRPVNLAAARQPSMAEIERDVKRMELDRRKRAIGFDIDALESQIRRHQEDMDRELRTMREQQVSAAANPFDPARPQPTATDMLAVAQRYQVMIATAQDRIVGLRQEARQLDTTSVR